MKPPINPNYCATIVEIKTLLPIENCDNVVSTSFFGFKAVVGKDVQIGDKGVFFPPEVQLSDEFCAVNNLYRHKDKNKDPEKFGYIEDNRRVKAIKFRGNVSNCLFLPITCIYDFLSPVASRSLDQGTEFDFIEDTEICRKYVIPTKSPREQQKVKSGFQRVDKRHFPEHIDTTHFLKVAGQMKADTPVIITAKLHGTSIRIGHTIVARKLNFFEKLLKRLSVRVMESEFDYVFGSRKVTKDINNPNQAHFYDEDIWTREGKKLEGVIPTNYLVYGELIGWVDSQAPIQKGYTYNLPDGVCKLYVYRVAFVNSDGIVTDLSWDQVKEFCLLNGLLHVPELHRCKVGELVIDLFMNRRFADEGWNSPELGSDHSLVDEGICIRVDGLQPQIYKEKSSQFLEHESSILDTGVEDLESSQGEI